VNSTFACGFAGSPQESHALTVTADIENDDVAAACMELTTFIHGLSSSSSSSTDERVTDALSVLILAARRLRARALQLQHTSDSTLQQTGPHMADALPASSFTTTGRRMQAVAAVIPAAAGYAAHLLNTIINSCSDAHQASSSSSSSSSSDFSVPLPALQQLQQRLMEVVVSSGCVGAVLWSASRMAGTFAAETSAGRAPPPVVDAGSGAIEDDRIVVELLRAANITQLLQVLGRYDALWQLLGSALLLSEQLLAGLPCDWCCNNPGCTNTAGPSERALVGGKSCKCAGCRTARWALRCFAFVASADS
jgi:hypothetical protein